MDGSTTLVTWNQADHDVLIEVRTSMNILVGEVKTLNSMFTTNLNALDTKVATNINSLDIRIRALENTGNRQQGGWRTLVIIIGAIAGMLGLIISYLNYFSLTVHR